jgi:hypothetical protein
LASNYLVLYGTNFGSSPTVSGLPSGASESWGSNKQINILLGSYTGAYNITVNGAGGCTGTATGTIVAVPVTPTPTVTPTPAGTISISPNPIPVACGANVGSTTVTSSANVGYDIHVAAAGTQGTGSEFAEHPGDGSTYTNSAGGWVSDGLTFYLIDSANGATLAQVTAHLQPAACVTPTPTPVVTPTPTVTPTPAGTISANPNPIQVCTGTYTGATAITSSANVPYTVYSVVPYSIGSNVFVSHPGDGLPRTDATNSYVSNGNLFYLVSNVNGARAQRQP